MTESRHLLISGRVQGVGYRAAMMREARRLELKGWVRNLRNGLVEAVVEGSPDAVAAIIAWARCGPGAARVDGVEVELGTSSGEFSGFEQKPTV